MRFDPAKSYPHPVLRPSSSDYPHAEFQVEITLERARGGTALRARAAFELSAPDLLKLVEDGSAQYVLRVRASKTHYRCAVASRLPTLEVEFPDGQLHGLAEFSPFLVCTDHVRRFSAEKSWHADYAPLSFDVEPGSVLAEDQPKEYWIDTADDAPVASIFICGSSDTVDEGEWQCDLSGERVTLEMSPADHLRFNAVRGRVNGTRDAVYILNAVYLPALIWVLQEADRGEEEFADLRWYRSLNARLEEVGCKPLGTRGADRLEDAQRLFQSPFGRMLLTAEAAE